MNAGACPLPSELVAYARGLPGLRGRADDAGPQLAEGARDESRARIEAHLVGCSECRLTLAALSLLADRLSRPGQTGRLPVGSSGSSPANPSETAGRASRNLAKRARPRWARVSAIAVGLVAAAAAVFIAVRPPDPAEILAEVQAQGPGGARPLELAFSDLPYAPYAPQRGNDSNEARFDRPLRKLLEGNEKARPGSARMLATLYAVRRGPGDTQRAERLLAQAGSDADSENDRAVMRFGQGDLLAAIEAVDRALEKNPTHRAARFNRGLLLARLGFETTAAEIFEQLGKDDPRSPWAHEAQTRAAQLRAPPARSELGPAEERRAIAIALLSAGTPSGVAAARAQLAKMPEGLVQDLSHLCDALARYPEDKLAEHGRLFARYQALRTETAAGHGGDGTAVVRALIHDAEADPLVLVPVLQLAAFRAYWRGALREEQELQLRVLHICKATGCDAVSEAIAADELAEWAGRDGDFAEAHRLQDRAEALFVSVAAELQLGELQQKRANLFLDEGRLDDATRAAILALRTLLPLRARSAMAARSTAAACAGGIASARHLLRAELELHRGGLALLAGIEAADESASLTTAVAMDEADLGHYADAKPLLKAELDRQLSAGHKAQAAQVRATAAALAEREGDWQTALTETTEALRSLGPDATAMGWNEWTQRLRISRARALIAVNGPGAVEEARRELTWVVANAVHEATTSLDSDAQLKLMRAGAVAGTELAALGVRANTPAPELLMPLDSLRATVFQVNAPASGSLREHWEQGLANGACVVALLPAQAQLVRLAITNASSQAEAFPLSRTQLAQQISAAKSSRPSGTIADPRAPTGPEQSLSDTLFKSLPPACSAASQLWLWVEAPLDEVDVSALPIPSPLNEKAALGFVNSLPRLLEPEPKWPPAETLLIDGAEVHNEDRDAAIVLPGALSERKLLGSLLGSSLLELSGPQLTPTALLARLSTARLLHAAVHGAESTQAGGGSLQLSGELGRLRTSEIVKARLPAGSRVVLAACHAAPGETGLSIAFARAGALEIASAGGAVDDEAAARWAGEFYPRLAQGMPFVEANREAIRAQPASGPRAWFVVSK
jgi:tetratricopeptide (TPR) repeat protein